MRRLQISGRHKRIRGLKRQVKMMVKNINYYTQIFPEDEGMGYWHLHLPVYQGFIDSHKTPFWVRRLCIQTLIHAGKRLYDLKPKKYEYTKVVVLISLPYLWDSQIIVFFDEEYYKSFFDRDDKYQQWIKYPDSYAEKFVKHFNLDISKEFNIKSYNEEIYDYEDEEEKELKLFYSGDLFFVGEFN